MATRVGRRAFLAGALGAGLGAAGGVGSMDLGGGAVATARAAAPPDGGAFGFDHVRERARRLAAEDFRDAAGGVPEVLRKLGYDRYRAIRFRPEEALWSGDPGALFRAEFFHLGSYYLRPVRINVVDGGLVLAVGYSKDLFDYGDDGFASRLPDGLGFAGFRLRYPLHRAEAHDEVAAFLGASYFRVLGQHQRYGLSARGLAVNTALASGEEFPFFREFWLEKPAPGATSITFYALLDGPSVAGAYRFVLEPGAVTRLGVEATLYPRSDIERIGLAPLTSMFLFGENTARRPDDFRPEVHDSDGLAAHNGAGEWLWRPLANHRELQVSSFVDRTPRGFGLFQRDRAFANYQDLEAMPHLRPTYWVEPVGDWGEGMVQLVEIPSEHEGNDNIVAYWTPVAPVPAGERLDVAYRLHALLAAPDKPPRGRVEATRVGPGRGGEGARRFVLDFVGGGLEDLAPDAPLELVVGARRGEIPLQVVMHNPVTGGRRVFFDFVPADEAPTDLRCYLRLDGRRITETWLYLWTA